MKKALLVVASLLAVSSVMAAMAFSSATVKNDANFSIVDTSGALLAIEAGEHQAAGYEERNDGAEVLVIDFDKGKDGQEYGLQPNSEYTWIDLFKVTNNSENSVDLTIDFEPSESEDDRDLTDADVEIAVNIDGNWKQIDGSDNSITIPNVDPGTSKSIDVRIIQNHDEQTEGESGDDNGLRNFQIVVSAESN
ncbi:hypothetical protein [Chengkuizengella axinellae]|uniref:DUF1102 domain-containing protein n=1 Tax=Chengkuizengella axinellae TaxID=3064388 RepID=A0ABT9IYJ6_9BACL|nr:hypothetical protein [Chengkuizengella sp. 2205SS18-9]MDP5274383.1 hypothetical protein [Chengkuizengella sp. 2205SS18-9]